MTSGIPNVEVVGTVVGAVLTLMVFSYLLGDNPLYRFALHLFVGVLVGYSFGVVLRDILCGMVLAKLLTNPSPREFLAVAIPLMLGIMLLFKSSRKRAYVGNFSVAFLVGVGTAVALGGALLGTLIPQIGATGRAFSSFSLAAFRDGLIILIGTVCTLMAFTFTVQRQPEPANVWSRIVRILGGVGRGFLVVAFGVAFAGALTASLSIFIGRIQHLIDAFTSIYFSIVGG